MTATRRGATLIELLVVIAIISTLLGLLIPAVQKVRSTAARGECENNAKQIAIALHHFHNVNHRFPAGMRWKSGRDPMRWSTWLAAILPYVDQEALWAQTQNAYQKSPRPFLNPPHTGLATVVPLYVCPADGRGLTAQTSARHGFSVALTSYLGVSGTTIDAKDGVLFRDSAVRLVDVTDGASNTILSGERPPSSDYQFGWWYAGGGQRNTGSCDAFMSVQEQNLQPVSASSCAPGVYTFAPGTLSNPCDAFHFWSPHSGGANFALCDGSVRFLRYEISAIMPALATRSGADVAIIE